MKVAKQKEPTRPAFTPRQAPVSMRTSPQQTRFLREIDKEETQKGCLLTSQNSFE